MLMPVTMIVGVVMFVAVTDLHGDRRGLIIGVIAVPDEEYEFRQAFPIAMDVKVVTVEFEGNDRIVGGRRTAPFSS